MASPQAVRSLVPCELCDQMIYFDEYVQHTRVCIRPRPQNVIVVEDEEDGNSYQLVLDDAIQALMAHNLGRVVITDNVGTTNAAVVGRAVDNIQNRSSGVRIARSTSQRRRRSRAASANDDDDDPEEYIPRSHNHQSVIMLPRIIRNIASEDVPDMQNYEFNSLISDRIGKVKVGIKDLSKVIQDYEGLTLEEEVCVICQDTLGNNPMAKTLCKHIYCRQCITQWLNENKKCPVCQVDLEEAAAVANIESEFPEIGSGIKHT
jgi:hypothetical protein